MSCKTSRCCCCIPLIVGVYAIGLITMVALAEGIYRSILIFPELVCTIDMANTLFFRLMDHPQEKP